MDNKYLDLEIKLAEYKGEVKTLKEIYNQHTTQEKEKFDSLESTVKEINKKLDKVLLNEAERVGEIKGVKRTTMIIATLISLIIGGSSLAINLL